MAKISPDFLIGPMKVFETVNVTVTVTVIVTSMSLPAAEISTNYFHASLPAKCRQKPQAQNEQIGHLTGRFFVHTCARRLAGKRMDDVANAVVGIKRVQTAFERRAGLKNASRRQVVLVFSLCVSVFSNSGQIGLAYFTLYTLPYVMHLKKIAYRGRHCVSGISIACLLLLSISAKLNFMFWKVGTIDVRYYSSPVCSAGQAISRDL